MHGLFFMSDSLELDGVEDQSIHIFETEEADQWLLEKLIGAGVVNDDADSSYGYDGCDFDALESLLEAIREDYEGDGEYLHVYPAVDHRTEVAQ